ncbi:MAG TPA: YCF48-related protein [Terriglobales bacterium]|nr:YCF48-related protein [Terriglobales bacterium]
MGLHQSCTCRRRRWPALPLFAALALVTATSLAGAARGEVIDLKDHLYAVATRGSHIWVGGVFGSVVHSADDGASWTPQPSASTEHIFGIAFADDKVGWAVGRNGTISATVDGGATWKRQTTPKERHLFHVVALDTRRAAAIGDWGTILITADGGETWQDRALTRDVILNGQAWVDPDHGWIVGELGAVFATEDGGATWKELASGVEKTLYDVAFRSRSEGFAVGLDGLILATSDGGATWTPVHGEAELGGLEQVGSHAGMENPHLYDVVLTPGRVYAAGDNSRIFTSEDHGRTWIGLTVPQGADLRWLRAAAASGERAYFAGADGLVLVAEGAQVKMIGE